MKNELLAALDAAEKAEIDKLRADADTKRRREIEDQDPYNRDAMKRRLDRNVGALPLNLDVRENQRLVDSLRQCYGVIDTGRDLEELKEFVDSVDARTKTMLDRLRRERRELSA